MNTIEKERSDAWRHEPARWKLGIFYYNKEDKRIFPPKKIAYLGWTINFANPYSIVVNLGILLFFIVIAKYINK
jgi:uncharacterized membrane protein